MIIFSFTFILKGVLYWMGNSLRFAVEERKKQLIDTLIRAGVYKVPGKQLYELSLCELERECENIREYIKA